MAIYTIDIDTGQVPLSELVDTVCELYAYQSIINGSSNPESKGQFATRMEKKRWADLVYARRVRLAKDTATGEVQQLVFT